MAKNGKSGLVGLFCIALVACGTGPDSGDDQLRALELTDSEGQVFLGGTYAANELDLVEAVADAVIAAQWQLDDVVLRSGSSTHEFPSDGIAEMDDLAVGSVVSIESEGGQPLMALRVMPESWVDGLPEATATRFPLCGGALPD